MAGLDVAEIDSFGVFEPRLSRYLESARVAESWAIAVHERLRVHLEEARGRGDASSFAAGCC